MASNLVQTMNNISLDDEKEGDIKINEEVQGTSNI